MYKILKITFFISLFSNIFSLTKIKKIEPTTVALGDNVNFTLTVEDYDSSDHFSLFNFYYSTIDLECETKDDSSLNCNADIIIYNTKYYDNSIIILFVNGQSTDLNVTIIPPSSVKLLNFYYNVNFYTYGINSFYFEVNYNKIYNSTISIKIGDISLTNCEVDNESIHDLTCYCELNESYNKKTLNLIFNNEKTDYSITIQTPPEFSIIDYLDEDEYYVSSFQQYIYFRVYSSYKMNEHSFVLVPKNSEHKNITLFSCTYNGIGLDYGKCLGILDTVGVYDVYIDNVVYEDPIKVYPERTTINIVKTIEPKVLNLSSSEVTFTLEVDFVANLNLMNFTLIDEYNPKVFFDLKKCIQIDGTIDKITCVGKINYAGYYNVYLNGVFQKDDDLYVSVNNNSTLARAIAIIPREIKFNSSSTIEKITIVVDSLVGISSKKITLKGISNTITLNYNEENNKNYIEYNIKFPVPDNYYVYIDDINQNINILVTTESFISKLISIYPTYVGCDENFNYTLTVDSNYGIAYTHIKLDKFVDEEDIYCIPDKSDKTKIYCQFDIHREGEVYFNLNDTAYKNITIKSKETTEVDYFYPVTLFASSNSQKVVLIVSPYHDEKIEFISEKYSIQPECENITDDGFICDVIFKNGGRYYITFDGYFTNNFFNVIGDENNNNIIKDLDNDSNDSSDDSNESKDDNGNKENYIYFRKKLIFLLVLIFL